MIQLIGIKSDCDIDIRQKFSIVSSSLEEKLKKLNKFVDSSLILSTCNRTEVYVDSDIQGKKLINMIFAELGWNLELTNYIFYVKDITAVKHLLEVSCGFHSKILGEDQILGQIKDSYLSGLKARTIKGGLQRLFQYAITCGKEFKNACEMYKIPVSSPSIVVKRALDSGFRRYMIIGFGKIGKLVLKYLVNSNAAVIYVVVRDLSKISDLERLQSEVKFITFNERKNYYGDIDCIVTCTSAPHSIISRQELPEKQLSIFDLAVPRDVDNDVFLLSNIKVYDIDDISRIDKNNKVMRKQKMAQYRYIIDKYIKKFIKWQTLNELSPEIQRIKNYGEEICEKRIKTFKNKRYTKDNEILARIMIQSTAKVYINRAIKLLKKEKLNGTEDNCLRFIDEIFCSNEK
ncbi:glutamyl-tRNA reductase [Clostridium tyrobutyricum]|uniref:glutamyl-tRNA reductase n=1 Tax=Clostridium tyrobutyricum TaxID=1519 RepID=UPI001C385346|nr:glutamyl-tRNA reductase [Clostridium tyrobutyricum]MBV4417925.1 glutamyl-tRNA reductase [Clostridium tyrobutyricum]